MDENRNAEVTELQTVASRLGERFRPAEWYIYYVAGSFWLKYAYYFAPFELRYSLDNELAPTLEASRQKLEELAELWGKAVIPSFGEWKEISIPKSWLNLQPNWTPSSEILKPNGKD